MIRILQQQPPRSQTDLTAALVWIRGKMIYRFDDTLAAQPLDGKIPPEALNVNRQLYCKQRVHMVVYGLF